MSPIQSGPTEREARKVAEGARESEWTKPSFGKELFLGRLRLDLIHPWPTNTPEQIQRGESYLDRLRPYVETIDAARIEGEAAIPDEVFADLAALGAFGLKVPEAYGGVGLSHLYYCKALALVGSAHGAIGTLLSAHQSIGVPQPVKMFGNEEQKRRFLPRVAAGEVSAFLLTEPDVGSDPARLATSARPTPEGDFVLDGLKLWATNGTIAGVFVVLARVPASGEGAAASRRSWSRQTPPASPSSTAMPSWGCAASRTP